MIRKLIKFLKKCWGKKAAYAYAGLMLTACILTYKLYFASGSNIFKSEEEKASVASSVAEGKIAYGEKNIAPCGAGFIFAMLRSKEHEE